MKTGLTITVCHYPPGTSKWNKIEHRLFCHITQTWRGQPLTSRLAVVELIAATTTTTGLTVQCELDTNTYAKGIKVSDAEMAALNITATPSIRNGITPSHRAARPIIDHAYIRLPRTPMHMQILPNGRGR